MVFSNLAIQTKRKAPNAHSFLEIIRVRYGTFCHLTFMLFSLASNIVSSAFLSHLSQGLHLPIIDTESLTLLFTVPCFPPQLVVSSVLLGGAAAINSLTGMSVYAATWLLPLSVAAYTLRGGLRATLLTDYIHTAISELVFPPRNGVCSALTPSSPVLIILIILWFEVRSISIDLSRQAQLTVSNLQVYASGTQVGSPSKMFDLLQEAQIRNHDAATHENSYMTIRSLGALKFAILSILECQSLSASNSRAPR